MSVWPNYRSRIVHSHARMLLSIMVQRDWDDSLERDLANARIILNHNIVDQVIACIPSARLALQFFIWASEQVGCPPLTSTAACTVAQHYANKSQVYPFLKVLKGLNDPQFGLSLPRINVLLQGYGWASLLDRGFALMLRTNSFFNDILVKCFLQSVITNRRYSMVYDVYMEMKKIGTPLELCHGELIQGIAFAGGEGWREADLLFKQMTASGHAMNGETCNALTLSLCRAGEHERAAALLEYMLKNKIRLSNLTPDAIVECLCYSKQLHMAVTVMNEMKQHGYVLTPKVYRSFLEALANE
ncbi:hypothetical protein KP509_25G058000 [Ceratopteris richardii]|nr:hypothetical protein KP509_25G058000 [Ceratopteris richardii]